MLKKIVIASLTIASLQCMERSTDLVKTQIYSIGSFSRGDQIIAIIGVDQDGIQGADRALTNEDEMLFTNFIGAQKELTIFYPQTKTQCNFVAEMAISALKQSHASGQNLLLPQVFALKAQRFLKGHHQDGITFKFCPEQKHESLLMQIGGATGLFSIPFYSRLATAAKLDSNARSLVTLENQLAKTALFRKVFFSKKGQFTQYIDYIRSLASASKILPLLSDFEQWLSELKTDPKVKANSNLKDNIDKIVSYINTYKNSQTVSLIDIIAENMRIKKSVLQGLQEANNCVFDPFNTLKIALETHSLVSTMTTLHSLSDKKILLVIEYKFLEFLTNGFTAVGWKSSMHSAISTTNIPLEITVLPTQGIDRKTVKAFLNSVFEQLPLPQMNASSQPVQFLNQNTLQQQDKPFYDYSVANCLGCQKLVKKSDCFLHSKESLFCSYDCFIQKNRNWLIELVQADQVNERELLKRAYLFAHYSALIISPEILADSSEFYRSNHLKLAQYFHHITSKPLPWKKVVDLYASIGITSETIHQFLTEFAQAKKSLRQNMLNFFRQRSSITLENMNDWAFPQFDENLAIARRQKNIIDACKKALNVDHDVEDSSIIRYFRQLEKAIVRKLDTDIIDINSLFDTQLNVFITSSADKTPQVKKIQELDTPLIQRADADESESSEEVEQDAPIISKPLAPRKQKTKKHFRSIKDHFGPMPCEITLFNARSFLLKNSALEQAHRLFQTSSTFVFDKRITTLFSLVDALEDVSVKKDRYNMPLIDCPELNLDETVRERLNINHLFSRSVDQYIQSMGITEQKDGHLLVSIPGEIKIDNNHYIGFFQYSFNAKDWRCFHRCFVLYNSSISNEEHISTSLRQALYDYLVVHHSNKTEYEHIIKELKRILHLSRVEL